MAEVGSASFRARAQFREVMAAAKKVAAALRDVEDARKDASGDVEIGLDARGLRSKVRQEVQRATSGVDAEIEVDADTDPFERGFRAAMALAQRARVDVPVDADTDAFRRSMRALLVEGRSGRWKVYVPVELDGDDALAEARAIVELAEAGAGTVDVAMDPDGTDFIGEVRRIVATADATSGSIDVPLDADGDGLRREVSIWARIAGAGQRITIPVDADTGPAKRSLSGLGAILNPAKLARALLPLLAFPAIVTGVKLLIGAIGALGAAIVGVASQVGPLIGALATLPSLAFAIGGAFASVKLAFSGVGDALKAYQTAQKSAGKSAVAAAGQERQAAQQRAAAARQVEDAQRRLGDATRRAAEMRESAARRVADAEEGLQDAVRDSARQQVQAARQVESAERGLAQSHRNVQRALQALNDARQQAIEDLEDMRRGSQRNALDEERAILSIEEARANLNEVLADPRSTDLDRRRAALDLRDAELDLVDVRERRADDEKALREAERNGIEGTRSVIDAREDLAEAERGVGDAQRELADAQQGLADAQLEGMRRVRDAQRELVDAQKGYTQAQLDAAQVVADAQRDLSDAYQAVADAAADAFGSAASAVDPFEEAMAKLPKSAQDFVRFLIGLEPLLKRLRTVAADNLFPGLTVGMRNVVTLMPQAERLVGAFSRTVGGAAANLSTLAVDPGFRADLEATGVAGDKAFGSILASARPLLRMVTRLGAAAAPLTESLGRYVLRLSEAADAQVETWRSSGQLAAFFDETRDAADNLLGGLGNLIRGLINVGAVAYDVLGRQWNDSLRSAGDRFREWTESVEGRNRIREYFEAARPAIEELGRLLRDVAGVFGRFSTDPQLDDLIRKIRTEFLPALERLLNIGDDQFGAGIIDFLTALTDFLAALGGSGVFGAFLKSLTEFLELLTWAARMVPGAQELIAALLIMASLSRAVSFVAWITGLRSLFGFFSAKNAAGVSRITTLLSRLGVQMGATAAAGSAASAGVSGVGVAAAGASVPLLGYIAIAAAVVAAIAAIGYVVYRNWDTITATWSNGIDALDRMTDNMPVVGTAKRVLGRLVDAFRGDGEAAADAWNKALDGMRGPDQRRIQRDNATTDRFDKQAEQLIEEYDAAVARAQKDLDLGLIDEKAYEQRLKTAEQFLELQRQQLRKDRQAQYDENERRNKAETEQARRHREELAKTLSEKNPDFFREELEGSGGFDPGMNEELRRAQNEARLAEEGFVGGLQILANRVGYFVQDTVRGLGAGFREAAGIVKSTGAEMWASVQIIWALITAYITGKIEQVRLWVATKVAELRANWDAAWDATVGRTQRAWDSIWLIVSVAIERVRAWIGERLDVIRFLWAAAWEWLRSTALSAWERIRSTVTSALGSLEREVTGALDRLRGGWDRIWGGLADGLSGIWSRIRSTVRSGANDVIGIVNGMISGFNGVLSRLPGGFQVPSISTRFRTGGEVSPMAAAGLVPGTGRTDHVPSLLMPNEFVVRERVVRREGASKFRQLNEGRATIVSLNEHRRKRMRRGGPVGRPAGAQRMRRGGLVGGALDWIEDRARGASAAVLSGLWSAARSAARSAIGSIPSSTLPGQVGSSAANQILSSVDSRVQELIQSVRTNEEAEARAVAAARAAQAARTAPGRALPRNRTAPSQRPPGTVSAIAPGLPLESGPGLGFVRSVQERWPSATVRRVAPSQIMVAGVPYDQILGFIDRNRQALRVSNVYRSGADSVRAEVFHRGGGVGFDPSKEVLALLQRGEGVMAKGAVGAAQTMLSPNWAVGSPVGSGIHQTVVNVEVNNPVGEPTEDSIHRTMQRVAAHGLLPPLEDSA